MSKLNFLKNEFPKLLQSLKADANGNWGVMNGQQMIEHMSDSVRIANGKEKTTVVTPAEKVETFKNFAMSDKEFKPNTKNVLMSETPLRIRNANVQEAIKELENELAEFINHFEKNKNGIITNPFFGDLNFEEWTHLLHKHAVHHAKQFGLM
jgi:hypothetical protein